MLSTEMTGFCNLLSPGAIVYDPGASGGTKLFPTPLLIAEVHHEAGIERISRWVTEYQYCAR